MGYMLGNIHEFLTVLLYLEGFKPAIVINNNTYLSVHCIGATDVAFMY